MHKFFVNSENIDYDNNKIFIDGEDVNHITRVLRLRNNDKILISDKKGNEHICIIESSDKKK